MTELSKIGTVILSSFILTFAWKWGESKWIKMFNIIRDLLKFIDKNYGEVGAGYGTHWDNVLRLRKDRHKFTSFVIVVFALITFAFMGLSFSSGIVFLITWNIFWVGDIFLNIFLKQKVLYRGRTAIFDNINFGIRFLILIILVIILIFIL